MTPNYKTISSTTQDYLDIYDVTNNLILLQDGNVAVVLTVSAMNFGLLAEQEQDAVIYTYAALLNSLNYPIQILIRSKTKDATSYLNLLQTQEQKTTNPKQRTMIAHYRQFVGNLIKERNVLDKKFYVIIPASSLELGLLPPASVLPGSQPFDASSVEKSTIIEKALGVLEPRRDHLLGQFARIGLFARQLETQEIIHVLYNSYNPEAEGQELTDTSNYTTSLVRASVTGGTMDNQTQTPPAQPSGDQQPPPAPTQATPPVQPQTPPPAPAEAPTATPTLETDISTSGITPPQAPTVSPEPETTTEAPASATPTPSLTPTNPIATPAPAATLPVTGDVNNEDIKEPITPLDKPTIDVPKEAGATPSPTEPSTPSLSPSEPKVEAVTPPTPTAKSPTEAPAAKVDTLEDAQNAINSTLGEISTPDSVAPATPAVTPTPAVNVKTENPMDGNLGDKPANEEKPADGDTTKLPPLPEI